MTYARKSFEKERAATRPIELNRHSQNGAHSGVSAFGTSPKKNGGGRFNEGLAAEQDGPAWIDRKDPNYDPEDEMNKWEFETMYNFQEPAAAESEEGSFTPSPGTSPSA